MREQLVILAVECPYTKSNPSTCPLHEVRKLKPTAIIDWLDALSGEEKEFLTQYHQCCLMTRWGRGRIEELRKVKRKAPSARRKARGKARGRAGR